MNVQNKKKFWYIIIVLSDIRLIDDRMQELAKKLNIELRRLIKECGEEKGIGIGY